MLGRPAGHIVKVGNSACGAGHELLAVWSMWMRVSSARNTMWSLR
jgi:hypothetical protein